MAFTDLDPLGAQELIDQQPDLVLLDVRTEPENRSHRLPGAVLIPVQELAARVEELDPDRPHLIYCEHGVRSVAACEFLADRGFDALSNLGGGMARWLHAGLPCERG